MASFATTISALFSKIIAFFMSILIMLFPNATIDLQQQRENDINKWIPIVEEAIYNKDVSATMDFMCEALRQDEFLPKKIQQLYQLIDGTPMAIEWEKSISASNETRSYIAYHLNFTTDMEHMYSITLEWQTVDLEKPEWTKCVGYSLDTLDDDGNHDDDLISIGIQFDDSSVVFNEIISSLYKKDTAVLEKYLCENIRNNTADTSKQIDNYYALIKGDIVGINFLEGPSWEFPDNTIQREYHVYIYTTEEVYSTYIDIQELNYTDPSYTGINGLYLVRPTPHGNEKLFYLASDNSVEQQNVKDWLSE